MLHTIDNVQALKEWADCYGTSLVVASSIGCIVRGDIAMMNAIWEDCDAPTVLKVISKVMSCTNEPLDSLYWGEDTLAEMLEHIVTDHR